MATPRLATTIADRASPSHANAIDGTSASNMTLMLVETIARWRIRIAGCHKPPGGTRVEVTAVNPAITTAIVAIDSSSGSPGMSRIVGTWIGSGLRHVDGSSPAM